MTKYERYKEYNRRYSLNWLNKRKLDPAWLQKYKEYQRNYAKKRYAEHNNAYAKMRFQILVRDDFTCQYCGRKSPDVVLEVDHIVPSSKGGKTEIENLQVACRDCNIGKSDLLLQLRK